MASSLIKEKTIDELIDENLAKSRARADRDQRRIDELQEQNAHFAASLRSSLVVPAAGFGMGYARGYFGEKASIFGISLDAGIGLLFLGAAALLGLSSDNAAQTGAKLCGDVANGALACWSAAAGAELGLQKRLETPAPVPAPQPNTGTEDVPQRTPRPMTHEELAALKTATAMPQRPPSPLTREEVAAFSAWTAMNTRPAMPERPSAPPWVHAPPPAPPRPPIRNTEVAPATTPAPAPQSTIPQGSPLNEPPPVVATAKIEPAAASPPAPQKKYRFTQGSTIDPEAEMRRLLQSHGAPSDPQTVASVLYDENPMAVYRAIVRKARSPA